MYKKREIWKGHYYIVKRRKGRIVSRKRYHRKVKKRLTPVQKSKRSVLRLKTVKKLSKKDIVEDNLLSRNTGMREIISKRQVIRKRCVTQIKFLFLDNNRRVFKITSRSNKLPPSKKKLAFDQCYQRALAQVTFSPVSMGILEVRYIYWEK